MLISSSPPSSHMKFPLASRPYTGVSLSPERGAELQALADRVLDATHKEFRDFVHKQRRTLPPSRWKAVKTVDGVTVYKELIDSSERTLGVLEKRHDDGSRLIPRMLAVGTVRRSLHDLMLANVLPDPASMLVKSMFTMEEFMDSVVVHEHAAASDGGVDPFRHTAVKWLVKTHSVALNTMISPRDVVVVMSSGILQDTQTGYIVMQSVDLTECPSLEKTHGIVRSKLSAVTLFQALAPTSTEVYASAYMEPNGFTPESITVARVASHICSTWNTDAYVLNEKLAWALKHHQHSSRGSPARRSDVDACQHCERPSGLTLPGKKRRLKQCDVCNTTVCHRCRVKKVLVHADDRLHISTTEHRVCTPCMMRVANEDARVVMAAANADRIASRPTTKNGMKTSFSPLHLSQQPSGTSNTSVSIESILYTDTTAQSTDTSDTTIATAQPLPKEALQYHTLEPSPMDLYRTMLTLQQTAQKTFMIAQDTTNRHVRSRSEAASM